MLGDWLRWRSSPWPWWTLRGEFAVLCGVPSPQGLLFPTLPSYYSVCLQAVSSGEGPACGKVSRIMTWQKTRQQHSQARSSVPVHWLSIPGPNSLLSLLTIEQERFWVLPETLTTGQILIVEILSHNAKHQLFTHHELHEAIILSWNSELQVVGYRGVFSAGGQVIDTDRQTLQ